MLTNDHEFRQRCLLGVADLVRRIPNVRGKTRVLMEFHRLLGLEQEHFSVSTVIHHPIPYRAKLDLFCKHERMAFFMDRYEPGTVEFLSRLWQPGEVLLDVGANIGLIAIPFSLLCSASGTGQTGGSQSHKRCYCIEAVPANLRSLAANVELNGLGTQIGIIRSAVGESEKEAEIQVERNQTSGAGTGTANILPSGSAWECERIPLHVTTVDKLFADGRLPRNCGLMKVDTDGYDLFALLGARKFIEEARPLIYGEFMAHCLNWHGQNIDDVQAYLGPLDYTVYARGRGWTFTPLEKGAQFVQDALCVPNEKTERVRWCIS